MKNELLKQLAIFGIDVIASGSEENGHYSSQVELVHAQTGTTIAFCQRDSDEEALAHLVAKCVENVARVKVLMEDGFRINPSDIQEL